MKNHLFTLIAALGLMVFVAPTHSSAQQMPNINLNAMIQNQVRLQKQGDARAMALARAYYNYMLRLRRAGYTGPSLPTGVTAESLNATNQRLQGVMDYNVQRTAINQEKTYNAIDATREAIVHGCQTTVDPYNHRTMICP